MKTLKSKVISMNGLIADLATGGNDDYVKTLKIRYSYIDPYLAVHAEDPSRSKAWYLLFFLNEETEYDRQKVLHPSYEEGDFQCLYFSAEDEHGSYLYHMTNSNWRKDLFAVAGEYTSERQP